MSYKPYYFITGGKPEPQFFLKDYRGREYGVVEHYSTGTAQPSNHVFLEFFSSDPQLAERPGVWLDLDKWEVVSGHGKNLPEPEFEQGLEAYLQTWPDRDKDLRRKRSKQARFFDITSLAGEGYTIAFQELFAEEVKDIDFPEVEVAGSRYIADDQYTIQPGDFRNQVTLVLVPKGESGKSGGDTQAALIFNWIFTGEYEIVHSTFAEEETQLVIRNLVGNRELEKKYQERLQRMRRQGTLLGVKPKPYEPQGPGQGSGP